MGGDKDFRALKVLFREILRLRKPKFEGLLKILANLNEMVWGGGRLSPDPLLAPPMPSMAAKVFSIERGGLGSISPPFLRKPLVGEPSFIVGEILAPPL